MTIHVGTYFKWNNKKKDFEKPKLIVTRDFVKKPNNSK